MPNLDQKDGVSKYRNRLWRFAITVFAFCLLLATFWGMTSGRWHYWRATILTALFPQSDITQADTQRNGDILYKVVPGDVALVVHAGNINESLNDGVFESVKWSYAWLNFLEQELGTNFSVTTLHHIATGSWQERRLLILTSSATAQIPSYALLKRLYLFVEQGGCLILETPTAEWRPLSGGEFDVEAFNGNGGTSRSRLLCCENLPHSVDDPSSHQGERQVAQIPLFSFIHSTRVTSPGTQRRGIIRDEPALWQRKLGKGWVISLSFDFGMYLQAMQQGVPTQGWKVREVAGFIPALVESQDLALSRDMVNNDIPHADIMEDWLADYCESAMGAWPRWWRFPYQYDGILALTHDDEGYGPGVFAKLWKLEKDEGVHSTIFAISDKDDISRRWKMRGNLQGDSLRKFSSQDASGRSEYDTTVGLHWNRLWPYTPIQEQISYAKSNNISPLYSRIHYLMWGRNYARPFREMANSGVLLDSSYGPNRGRGYLFGTSIPFHIIDSNGLPLNLWEWPFVAQENWSNVTSEYIDGLLRESSHTYHQAPAILLHPHRWVVEPEGEKYFRDIVASARKYRHWIANFDEYREFREQLTATALDSAVNDGKLFARVFAPQDGLGLVLTSKAQNICFDGHPAEKRALFLNRKQHWLLAVPSGKHVLTADLPELMDPLADDDTEDIDVDNLEDHDEGT